MVQLDPLSLVEGYIFKRSFMCHKIVLKELVWAHLESAECAASLGKEAARETFLKKVSSNGLLKPRLSQS